MDILKESHLSVKIKQTIQYFNPIGYEYHKETAQAVLRELKTYTLLRYTNREDQMVSVKWYPEEEEIELKQPNGTFVFRLTEPTTTIYKTPAGVWQLQVNTQQIRWEVGKSNCCLTIQYTLSLHDEKLGKYEFKLQYAL